VHLEIGYPIERPFWRHAVGTASGTPPKPYFAGALDGLFRIAFILTGKIE